MKEKILAVHESEVAEFFRSIGLSEPFENGEIVCDICGDRVTTSSFVAAAKKHQHFVFCCNRPACYLEFVLRTRQKP